MKLFMASVAIASLAVSSALAADLPSRKFEPVAPVIAPIFAWTGFYAGVNGGYGFGSSKLKNVGWGRDASARAPAADASDATRFGAWTNKRSGSFVGGGQIGYNHQVGSVVVGIEADINYANVASQTRGMNREKAVTPGFTSGDVISARSNLNWFGTVRPRIGFVATERLMVFATGGLAYGGVESRGQYTDTLNGKTDWNFGSKKKSTRTGWVLGAGAEYALTDNITLKGEYLYMDLGAKTHRHYGDGDFNLHHVTSKDDLKFQTVRVGLNYKF